MRLRTASSGIEVGMQCVNRMLCQWAFRISSITYFVFIRTPQSSSFFFPFPFFLPFLGGMSGRRPGRGRPCAEGAAPAEAARAEANGLTAVDHWGNRPAVAETSIYKGLSCCALAMWRG
eukprot:1326551-Prymnesium_polylepis.1